MHLGMDVAVGLMVAPRLTVVSSTVHNLATTMAGADPIALPLEVEGAPTNLAVYTFALPSGGELVALWTNGPVVDDDPGVSTTLTFPGLSAQKVIGLDVLNGFEQKLITANSTSPASASRNKFQGIPRHNRPETQMLVSITTRTNHSARRWRRT